MSTAKEYLVIRSLPTKVVVQIKIIIIIIKSLSGSVSVTRRSRQSRLSEAYAVEGCNDEGRFWLLKSSPSQRPRIPSGFTYETVHMRCNRVWSLTRNSGIAYCVFAVLATYPLPTGSSHSAETNPQVHTHVFGHRNITVTFSQTKITYEDIDSPRDIFITYVWKIFVRLLSKHAILKHLLATSTTYTYKFTFQCLKHLSHLIIRLFPV